MRHHRRHLGHVVMLFLVFLLVARTSRCAGLCSAGASGLMALSAGFSVDAVAAGFFAAAALGVRLLGERTCGRRNSNDHSETRITLANIRENRFIVSIHKGFIRPDFLDCASGRNCTPQPLRKQRMWGQRPSPVPSSEARRSSPHLAENRNRPVSCMLSFRACDSRHRLLHSPASFTRRSTTPCARSSRGDRFSRPMCLGASFGDAGAYERISGRVYFALAMANPHNQRIVDLSNAVNLKNGEVEFFVGLYRCPPEGSTQRKRFNAAGSPQSRPRTHSVPGRWR